MFSVQLAGAGAPEAMLADARRAGIVGSSWSSPQASKHADALRRGSEPTKHDADQLIVDGELTGRGRVALACPLEPPPATESFSPTHQHAMVE